MINPEKNTYKPATPGPKSFHSKNSIQQKNSALSRKANLSKTSQTNQSIPGQKKSETRPGHGGKI